MKISRWFTIAFLLLFFAACATPDHRVPPHTIETRPMVTSTEVISTQTQTPSFEWTTTSPVATGTFTPQPDLPPFEIQPLEVRPELPGEENIQGVLVLASSFDEELLDGYLFDWLHLWNLETNQEQERLPGGFPVFDAMISPDHRWLAYRPPWVEDEQIEKQNAYLVVMDATGQELYLTYREGDKPRPTHWLNNEQITMRRGGEPYYSTFTVMGVINPFDGEYLELLPDPKDIYRLWPLPKWENGMVVYDPTRTYRAYYSDQEDMVLENLKTNEVIGHYSTAFDITPRWSPDGQMLLSVKPQWQGIRQISFDLRIHNYDGHETILFSEPDAFVKNAFWSDDGKRIAFWVSLNRNWEMENLAVYDLETRQTTIFDFQVNEFPKPLITWAPDGEYLTVGYFTKGEENHTLHGLLVKWQDAWAVKLPENKIPIGWMVMPEPAP